LFLQLVALTAELVLLEPELRALRGEHAERASEPNAAIANPRIAARWMSLGW
jgi:hypothetical protein